MELALFNLGLALLSRTHCSDCQCTDSDSSKREKPGDEARRIFSLLIDQPIFDNDILTEDSGRPYFPDKDMDFNISHSSDMVAVSLVSGKDLKTGCDIQFVNKPMASNKARLEKIAMQFFSADEVEYIFSKDAGCEVAGNTRFFQIWALKECFIKLRGLSVFDMVSIPSFIRNDICNDGSFSFNFAFEQTGELPLQFYLYEIGSPGNQYILALAIEGEPKPQASIQWFSESVFPISSIVEIKAAQSPMETVNPKT